MEIRRLWFQVFKNQFAVTQRFHFDISWKRLKTMPRWIMQENDRCTITTKFLYPPPMHRDNSRSSSLWRVRCNFSTPRWKSLHGVTKRKIIMDGRVASIYVIVTFPVERSRVPRKKSREGGVKVDGKVSPLYEADISPRVKEWILNV